MRIFVLLLIFSLTFITLRASQSKSQSDNINRHRSRPDETQSLIRLLFCSNENYMKGLIAAYSFWHKAIYGPGSTVNLVPA